MTDYQKYINALRKCAKEPKKGGAAYDEMPEVWDGDKINSDEG